MRFTASHSTRRRVTVGVWVLGVLLATILIARRPSSRIRGLAWSEPVVLTAPSDGALTALEAALHQSVSAGDRIARFDPEMLTARRQVLMAGLEALSQAQIAERQARTRLFERDLEAADLELGALTARADEAQARVDTLHEELEVEEQLFAVGVVPRERALAVRREIKVVETRLAADRERLELARSSARRASDRAETAPGPNQWQVEAARRELDEIEKQIERLVLRTPIGGQITEIYRRPGEWLLAGEPVLRVSPMTATEVHAWLDSEAPRLGGRDQAKIRGANGRQLTGVVKSVGAERLEMPRSLWARSDAPEWGYLLRIEVPSGSLSPGEPVLVGLR